MEGCLVVEMECAAMAAVATFRTVQFGQYLLAGDDISGDEWDGRGWSEHSVMPMKKCLLCPLRHA